MSETLPNHDELADVFTAISALHPPSELHGFFVGQLVLGARLEDAELRDQVKLLLDVDQVSDPHWVVIACLLQATREQLLGEVMGLELLLPDDDVDFSQRVAALGSWCEGFLTGFAMAGKHRAEQQGPQSYSDQISEILTDIAAISQVGLESDISGESEEQLDELVEYLRTAAVTIFVECCGALMSQESTTQGKLH